MDKKDLVEQKENIFSKIRNFFLGLFKKKDTVEEKEEVTQSNETQIENHEKSDFEEYVKIDQDLLLLNDLKFKLDTGKITVDDVPEDKLTALSKMYEEENENLCKEIITMRRKVNG